MAETTPTLLDGRALLRIGGEHVRGFLQGLVTQDVETLDAAVPRWGGLLTPQGKALFDFLLWIDEESGGGAILIDCEAEAADALARRLALYRLRRAITIERVAGEVHWSLDPGRGAADPRLPELGYRWLQFPHPASPAEAGIQGEGKPMGPAAASSGTRSLPGKESSATARYRAHRLSLGVTEGEAELGRDKTLWLECNSGELNGVSFTKGCYVGQENTARMHHRAKVNRRLVVAPLAEPTDRTRATYPDLGVMVELRRVEALGDALVPAWLRQAANK